MIAAAAIRLGGQVHSLPQPARHVDIRVKLRSEGVLTTAGGVGEAGFLDEMGFFLLRSQAALHALKCGQVEREKINWNLGLFSEDLW
jgi:hypothetical protein